LLENMRPTITVYEGPDVEDLCQAVFLIALRRRKRVPRDLVAARLAAKVDWDGRRAAFRCQT
jgi:hypothetical protein